MRASNVGGNFCHDILNLHLYIHTHFEFMYDVLFIYLFVEEETLDASGKYH